MCEFHDSNCNWFGDIWWTDKCIYFSSICFEMSLFVVEAIRGRCASFMILTATGSEIFGGQTNVSILVV